MEQLELYVPKLEDLWFYQKMMSDPETMSYNANWDVNYDGYHRDTGCVDYPDAVLPAWYENMVGQEPERFYAYIKRSADGAWIGDVNFHYNPAKDWWDMGIVLYAPYRGKGYAVPALKLMLEHAFRDCGISRIHNDFEVARLHEFYIITGANMAGKSTFLRAIGVNLVLACCGAVVRAECFEFQPTALFTSMRTVDNLAKGTSYFHAELLRLQQLVNMAQHEERLFIILDEILKGTNSRDKLNGSRRFLQKLLTLPVAGLVATHDLELGELANTIPDNFFNRCFEITHTDDDIAYDYKLKPGISQNMNASILLEKMKLV